MVKVQVKWQKETFKDVEVDDNLPPLVFKGQMFALTGVAPERQKIMVKGGVLKVGKAATLDHVLKLGK